MRDNHAAEVITLYPGSSSRAIDTTGSLPPKRGPLLIALFDASSPVGCSGPSTLHSVWTAEAMNGAKTCACFAMLLEYYRWDRSRHGVSSRAELACADLLALALKALEISDGNAMLPCAESLGMGNGVIFYLPQRFCEPRCPDAMTVGRYHP